jgi:lambda family phage minor tail protein L
VEFELASAFDLAGVRAPKRQCISSICQWRYRSAECSYTGTNYFDANDSPVGSAGLDVCGKRITSCKARFGQTAELPFGSYPGVGTSYT